MLRLSQCIPQVGQGCFEVLHGVPAVSGGGAQVFYGIRKPVRHIGGQVAGLLRLVHHIIHLAGQFFHQVHRICGVVQDGVQFIREPGEPGGQVIDLVNIFISPVCGGVHQITHGLLGLSRPVGDGLHPLRDLIGGAADIVPRLVNQAPQHIQFV